VNAAIATPTAAKPMVARTDGSIQAQGISATATAKEHAHARHTTRSQRRLVNRETTTHGPRAEYENCAPVITYWASEWRSPVLRAAFPNP
jgi:hypothetical protein